jgi:hypothetical protein
MSERSKLLLRTHAEVSLEPPFGTDGRPNKTPGCDGWKSAMCCAGLTQLIADGVIGQKSSMAVNKNQ